MTVNNWSPYARSFPTIIEAALDDVMRLPNMLPGYRLQLMNRDTLVNVKRNFFVGKHVFVEGWECGGSGVWGRVYRLCCWYRWEKQEHRQPSSPYRLTDHSNWSEQRAKIPTEPLSLCFRCCFASVWMALCYIYILCILFPLTNHCSSFVLGMSLLRK